MLQFSTLLILVLSGVLWPSVPADHSERVSEPISNGCPAEVALARNTFKSFIEDDGWASRCIATGTNSLTVGQIQLLTNPTDETVCETLNDLHAGMIAKTVGAGNDKNYDVVFYKAGSFYFVIIVLAQPAHQDYYLVGLSFINIYDSNLQRIKGYSF